MRYLFPMAKHRLDPLFTVVTDFNTTTQVWAKIQTAICPGKHHIRRHRNGLVHKIQFPLTVQNKKVKRKRTKIRCNVGGTIIRPWLRNLQIDHISKINWTTLIKSNGSISRSLLVLLARLGCDVVELPPKEWTFQGWHDVHKVSTGIEYLSVRPSQGDE